MNRLKKLTFVLCLIASAVGAFGPTGLKGASIDPVARRLLSNHQASQTTHLCTTIASTSYVDTKVLEVSGSASSGLSAHVASSATHNCGTIASSSYVDTQIGLANQIAVNLNTNHNATSTAHNCETVASKSYTDSTFYTLASEVVKTGDTQEPTGFINRSSSSIAFDSGSRLFTIAPVAPLPSFGVWINGTRHQLATQSINIGTATGTYYVFYGLTNASMTVQATPWSITSGAAPIAIVYWDGNKGFLCDERHGINMSSFSHAYLHSTVGTRYASGLTLTANISNATVSSGILWDEDVQHSIGDQTQFKLFYRNGSNYTYDSPVTKYYLEDGSGNLQYDNGGTRTNVGTGNYVCQWFYGTNSTQYPIHVITSQAQYTSLANARAATADQLSLSTLPVPEMKLLYKVIIHKSSNTTTEIYDEATDYRNISNLPSASYIPTQHSSLAGLTVGDDHPQYTLDTEAIASYAALNGSTTQNFSMATATVDWSLVLDGFTSYLTRFISLRNGVNPYSSGGIGIGAYDHEGGSSDGLALYGHDGVSLWTGQTERMRVTNSGNVAIGTTTSTLGVNGSAKALIVSRDTTNGGGLGLRSSNCNLDIAAGDNSIYMYSSTPSDYQLWANGSEKVRVKSDGEVLIATSTDAGNFKLQLAGAMNVDASEIRMNGGVSYLSFFSSDRQTRLGFMQHWNDRFTIANESPNGAIVLDGEVLVATSTDAGNFKLQVAGASVISRGEARISGDGYLSTHDSSGTQLGYLQHKSKCISQYSNTYDGEFIIHNRRTAEKTVVGFRSNADVAYCIATFPSTIYNGAIFVDILTHDTAGVAAKMEGWAVVDDGTFYSPVATLTRELRLTFSNLPVLEWRSDASNTGLWIKLLADYSKVVVHATISSYNLDELTVIP